jgi:DNA-binding NtrC family response regulator
VFKMDQEQEERSRITYEVGQVGRFVNAARLELLIETEAGIAANRTVILDGDGFRIGSNESCELVLNDRSVSRFHCRLVHDRRGWRVTDIDSLNGVKLQGVRIMDAYLPGPECTLQLGDSVVRVRERPSHETIPVSTSSQHGELFGHSLPMRKLFALIDRVAKSDTNVLIEGESGTGKERVATEIVRGGTRANKPFIIVDCSAISPNLIESELFGHIRGAFTGAERDRVGAFEAANGGTVFLDEVGELPLDLQPKLLRALEAKEIRRVGENETRKVDVRVVAATNRRLDLEVNRGRFREDLYFRLSVVNLRVPALRERKEDIELLLNVFLEELNASSSAHLFTVEVLDQLRNHEWPGNVRELRNYVERAVVLQTSALGNSNRPNTVEQEQPRINLDVTFREGKELLIADFERRYVTALLEWAEGNISKASRKAQMDRMNLYRLIQRYNIRGDKNLGDV